MLGVDISLDACRTAMAAGHARVVADVATFPLEPLVGRVEGAILSPPCKDWSSTGTLAGYAGETGHLLREPLRWCLMLRPLWTAWECTPNKPVRARFAADAEVLQRAGYDVWTGVLNAEDYGVPSTRKRAILVAHRGRTVGPPTPTLGGPASMAHALGWDGAELVSNYGTGGDAQRRGRRPMHMPAFTMTGKCGRNKWAWPDGTTRPLSIDEAAQLQSFRPNYPWHGGSTSQQQQVGDAVPPLLAAAILRPLINNESSAAA
ncbi:DNA (cytosine-5)-methyltransferase 1 [Kibdelosporangium banguiense]|uniref:DNA (cytosine-5-)-methyltransferase n=2 Tax=Kibdelosporangium banguiense TaxID=1365924 RepID=A0ABS4U3M7_9PSEU|nr:DNA (cytosine-5)-methyltransferase 1 [Kibdelosporangium banguiense]